ncbi:PEP-CTERM sorting domain-containing protein [Pseudobythopirellula maris]|nr:PEP-CTERM sorting domain-containing protein [Pseudobythopirellula maris]
MSSRIRIALMMACGLAATLAPQADVVADDTVWQGDTSGDWNNDNNWLVPAFNVPFVPQASDFYLRAIIGTEQADSYANSNDAPFGSPVISGALPGAKQDVGGLYLGLQFNEESEPAAGSLVGALTITGGTLNNVTTIQDDLGADGRIVVGADGRGFVTMTGGALTGTALIVGGEEFSGDSLGNSLVDLSGSASLVIDKNSEPSANTATLDRRLRIEGPDATFHAVGSITMGSSSSYNAVITSPTAHSAITSGAPIFLDGSLDVDFSGAAATTTHTVGQTWDLVESPIAVIGEFNNLGGGDAVEVSGLTNPIPAGGSYRVKKTVSDSGALVQLEYAAKLVLEVNRDTGELTITNPLGGEIEIDSYTIGSGLGSLKSTYDGVSGMTPSPTTNWVKLGLSANALSEVIDDPLSNGSSLDLSAASLGLGDGFDKTAVGLDLANFGTDGEDLTFFYAGPFDSSPTLGDVIYTGGTPKFENNLVLRVNPNTGEAFLKNDSLIELTFDGFAITSETGDLDGSGFTGLGAGWATSSPTTSDTLSQTALGTEMSLSPGEEVSIGDISATGFLTDAQLDGLGMEFILSVGLESTEVGGDYNGNGVVDAADFTVWRDNLDTSIALTNENPDAVTPGVVDQEDYDYWVSQFGQQGGLLPETSFRVGSIFFDPTAGASSSAAVPEPGALMVLMSGSVALLLSGLGSRRRETAPAIAGGSVKSTHTEGAIQMAGALKRRVLGVLGAGLLCLVAPSALAVTQGISLTNGDFELPGPAGEKTIAFNEDGTPNDAIPGWTFPGPGVENYGHENQLGDSGTEGAGNPGNEMILSTLDGIAYQTSAFNATSIPATQQYRLSFDAHTIFEIVDGEFEDNQTQLEARLYYLEADNTTRTTIDDLVISNLPSEFNEYSIDIVGGSSLLTPALGRPLGVEFDVTSVEFNPLVTNSWAGIDNVVLEIMGVAPGDFNGDGAVDTADYTIVNNSQQLSTPYSAMGEITGDGIVNLNDFRAFKNLYAASNSQSGAEGGTVPEPASLLLAVGGLMGLAFVGRSRAAKTRCAALGAVAMVGLLSAASPAQAELLFYDPFEVGGNAAAGQYTTGVTVDTQNPTVDTEFFAGPWHAQTSTLINIQPVESGLDYLGSPALGGALSVVASGDPLDPEARVARALAEPWTASTEGTFYISWISNFGARVDGSDMGYRGIEFYSPGNPPGEEGQIGRIQYNQWDPNGGALQQDPETARLYTTFGGYQIFNNAPASYDDDGANHLIVAKFVLSAEENMDSVSIYLDPTTALEPELPSASTSGGNFTLERIALANFGGHGGVGLMFDELRVADTWIDAVVDFPLPGDVNNDGFVDMADYNIIAANYNTQVGSSLLGDVARADGSQGSDGRVGIADYRIWRNNRTDLTGPGGTVPEPSGVLLMALAGLGLVGRRRG